MVREPTEGGGVVPIGAGTVYKGKMSGSDDCGASVADGLMNPSRLLPDGFQRSVRGGKSTLLTLLLVGVEPPRAETRGVGDLDEREAPRPTNATILAVSVELLRTLPHQKYHIDSRS